MARKKKETFLDKTLYVSHFVLRAFLIAFLCLLLGFGLIVLIYLGDMLVKGDSPLFSTYVIVTPSMVPTIKIDDAIVVKRVDNDKYKVGDIITFKSKDSNYEGLAVTHRIVEKHSISDKTSVYTTKGDNNKVIDPVSVKTDAIYGKVLFKVPYVGKVQDFLSHPANYLYCLLIPAIVFVLYDVMKIFMMITKKKKFSY
ncbi:MAG: signal peptidase I [Bacilli bacterium]|nr:signal peptidase I [Bacilli bacterium]